MRGTRSTAGLRVMALLVGALSVLLPACNDDATWDGPGPGGGGNGGGTAQSFTGTATSGGDESAVISLDVAAATSLPTATPMTPAAPQSTTGTFRVVGGSSASLTGSFDPDTGVLSVTGGGYTLNGTGSGGQVSGTYTGPDARSGSFVLLSGTASAVTAYCGTFTVTGGTETGTWTVLRSGSTTAGSLSPGAGMTGVTGGLLTGTLSGDTMSLTTTGGLTATGQVAEPTIDGTWSQGATAGTWQVSSNGC